MAEEDLTFPDNWKQPAPQLEPEPLTAVSRAEATQEDRPGVVLPVEEIGGTLITYDPRTEIHQRIYTAVWNKAVGRGDGRPPAEIANEATRWASLAAEMYVPFEPPADEQ